MTAPTLDDLTLGKGSHTTRDQGVCFMEAVAWYANEQHTDQPACVAYPLRSFGIALNDRLPEDKRQLLKPLIFDVIGTAGDGLDEQRWKLLRSWVTRKALPEWLELAKLDDLAAKARAAVDLSDEDLDVALYEIRDLTWKARNERWAPWREQFKAAFAERIRGQVVEQLRKANMPVAAVAAVAAAAADA
ncbi:MAG TPA: hypothetical protein VG899_12825, partial [Mycobacteriales bacterium]|nr:hypothetical protein [Mycobacteriales bacterium]